MSARFPKSFYLNRDVVEFSKNLLGKRLCTCIDGMTTTAIITETEAYTGINDKASHAYGGKITPRTEVMFREGAIAYVYLCYGIHHLFNIVLNNAGVPQVTLIRAVQPEKGIAEMLHRRQKATLDKKLCAGPGTVSKALGITTAHTGTSLLGESIWLEESGIQIYNEQIHIGPRIGVDYAGEDALLPYRFWVKSV
ncbi:MAG: DNA-3-methyladenine glycosylase [Bacteroidia bacterium]